jgi:hypothetical protein
MSVILPENAALELRVGNGHLEPMRWAWVAAALAAGLSAEAQQPAADGDVASLLAQIGARVEEFYARARTVTSEEKVRLQHLASDFSPTSPARFLVYDVRVAWEPAADGGLPPEASVLRQLRTVNGRAPRPKDEPGCTDPRDVSPDALSMLLPKNRTDYEFKLAGRARIDNRASVMIDFRSISKKTPDVVWKGTCVRLSLPGWTRGRLWVDADSHDVLRLDEYLTGMFDFPTSQEAMRSGADRTMILERADSSIRYREVKFDDPEETLTLPRLIETTTVWRNAGISRLRMTQEFSGYRRFITGARIVEDDDLR